MFEFFKLTTDSAPGPLYQSEEAGGDCKGKLIASILTVGCWGSAPTSRLCSWGWPPLFLVALDQKSQSALQKASTGPVPPPCELLLNWNSTIQSLSELHYTRSACLLLQPQPCLAMHTCILAPSPGSVSDAAYSHQAWSCFFLQGAWTQRYQGLRCTLVWTRMKK